MYTWSGRHNLVASKSATKLHNGAQPWFLRGAIVLVALGAAYLCFEVGRMQAHYNVIDAAEERGQMEQLIVDRNRTIVALEEQIILHETHRDIEKEAYREVESSLTDLQRKIQEQRDAIDFYRGIVSPTDGGRGLRVQDLKLTRSNEERRYNLRLVLVQVMQHDRSVKGEVNFSIDGAQDGVATTYTLEALLPPDGNSNWPFAFRYFQDFERELILPLGFMPERVNIEVLSRTKSIASVEQSFLWQTGQS
jgi:hypothetical protein